MLSGTQGHTKAKNLLKECFGEKLMFLRDKRLYQNCLSHSHFAGGCKGPRKRTIDDCAIAWKNLQSLHDALMVSFHRT